MDVPGDDAFGDHEATAGLELGDGVGPGDAPGSVNPSMLMLGSGVRSTSVLHGSGSSP